MSLVPKVTDRLFERQAPLLNPYAVDLEVLVRGSVSLHVEDVRPGEPIIVRWRVERALGSSSGQRYTIRLSIDGALVHQRSGIPIHDATVTGPAFLRPAEKGWQSETIVPSSAAAQSIYRFGRRTLKATVVTDAASDRPIEGQGRFRVIAEPLEHVPLGLIREIASPTRR